MASKINIGDVQVTDSACDNPYLYRGEWHIGESRRLALVAFRDGQDITGMRLWYAPSSGGCRRISASDVDWSGMGPID